MVDPDELRALAQERGASESETVRDAVRLALAGQEVATLRGLPDAGAFADFERLFPPAHVASPRRRPRNR